MTRAVLLSIVLLLPAIAAAQTTGTISGRVASVVDGHSLDGVAVVATSEALQGEQIAVTEPDGTFTMSLLPPGTYTVAFEVDGFRAETVEAVVVELGSTTPVTIDLVPTSIAAQTIRVTAEAPTVDRGSTEIGTNMDRDLLETTPHGRSYLDVLAEAPGASRDAVGTTVFGSTGVENSYVIEGMNTTDVGFGRAGTVLPTDFFEEIEMKTGGYMPEYGRSTGGIFNLVLRSGSNDFHGSLFANYAPGVFRLRDTPIHRTGEAIARQDHIRQDVDGGFTLGGPILRDRLWFFVGFDPHYQLTDVSRIVYARFDDDGDGVPDTDAQGRERALEIRRRHLDRTLMTWQFAAKLTLGIAPRHRLSVSYFGDPNTIDGVTRDYASARTSNGVNGTPSYYNGHTAGGSHNTVLSYEAQLLPHMDVEALAGFQTQRDDIENTNDQVARLTVYEADLNDFEPGTCPDGTLCPVSSFRDGGTGWFQDERLDRYTGGLRLTNTLAHHRIRYGAETEYKVYESTRGYSGGQYQIDWAPDPNADSYSYYYYYPYYSAVPDGHPDAPGAQEHDYFARRTDDPDDPYLYGTNGHPPFHANVATLTNTAFVQDSWEINRNFTLNGGLRWDRERLGGVGNKDAIELNDELAPRAGVSFDPSGDGRGRFFASWGWFYESVPMDINQRSFTKEGTAWQYTDENGNARCLDPNTQPNAYYYPYYYYGDNPAQPPYFQDGSCRRHWYMLGGTNSTADPDLRGQYQEEFVLGGEYEVLHGLVVGATGVARRLKRAIEDVSHDGGVNYEIANPGVHDCGVFATDAEAQAHGCHSRRDSIFPTPSRIYTGLVLSARQRLTAHLQLLASYTLSRLEGNYAGLYSPDNDQLDPNISSQYDIPDLMENRYGPLPGDHTHEIKLIGSYELGGLNPGLRGLSFGLGYHGESGSPINYLGRHPTYGALESFILPRGSAGRTPFVHRVDAFAGYDIPLGAMKLNANVTVFNVFNLQQVTLVDEEWTTDNVSPQPAGTKIEDVTGIERNPTFGEARQRQQPLYVRFGLKLSF